MSEGGRGTVKYPSNWKGALSLKTKQATPYHLHGFIQSHSLTEDQMNRRSKYHAAILCKAQSLIHRSYAGKGSYLKWGHLCVRGEIRTSLLAFRSEHPLTSMGPAASSPEGGHCLDRNRMEDKRWSQYSQHSYKFDYSIPPKQSYMNLRLFISFSQKTLKS